MLKLLDTMTDVLFRPNVGIAKAIDNSFTKALLFWFVLFTLIWFPVLKTEMFTIGFFEQVMLLLAKFSFNVLVLFFYCLLIHGLVNFFFNGQGSVKQLFSGFVFSYLPFLLVPLCSLLPQWQSNAPLQGLVFWLLFLWTVYLALLVIKNVYKLSYWRSNIILLMPLLFASLLYVCVVFYLFASFWLSLQIGL